MPGDLSKILFYFKGNAGESLAFESSGTLPKQSAGTACHDSFLSHRFTCCETFNLFILTL